jgi:hypothetical protein
MVTHACNPGPQEAEEAVLLVQSQLGLYNEFETSLDSNK